MIIYFKLKKILKEKPLFKKKMNSKSFIEFLKKKKKNYSKKTKTKKKLVVNAGLLVTKKT
jgi:hypothetical protein